MADEKKSKTEGPAQASSTSDLLISVERIREARDRSTMGSDGGSSGRSDSNDKSPA